MDIGKLSTDRPWAVLVFALVAVNAIGAFALVIGMDSPLAFLETGQGLASSMGITTMPASSAIAPAVDVSAAIGGAAILLLVLDIVILWGLSQQHVWAWWLLTFTTIFALVATVLGLLSGQALAIIPLMVSVVMIAALLKKETIEEFKPQLNIIPTDGLW